jgi:hypothetical protein
MINNTRAKRMGPLSKGRNDVLFPKTKRRHVGKEGWLSLMLNGFTISPM